MTELTLARALWLGYKHFRLAHPCSLVTPDRIAVQMRGLLFSRPESGTWEFLTGDDVCQEIGAGKCPFLALIPIGECGWIVTERPQYPGVGVPCYSEGGKIMWGGRNASTEA